ncbi:MAG: helix-turn-helix transcriptional regulator [Candidatus Heimdallarchaeota archaeon]
MSLAGDGTNKGTRGKILQYLLLNGSGPGPTVKQIAKAMGLSSNTIWNYLISLEKDGYIQRSELKGKSGRPAMRYTLVDKGIELFPKVYKDFCIYILDEHEKLHGKDKTIELLERIGERIAKDIELQLMRQSQNIGHPDSLKQKLLKFVNILKEYGVYPEITEENSSYDIKTHNCVLYGVMKLNPLICKIDEVFYAQLTDRKVIKDKCLSRGDNHCLFRVMKAEA